MKKNPISTRKIFPSSQVPPSSVISYGVFLLVFIILISFMLFRTSSQQENLINMNSRLIDLEQQVQKSVQSSEVTVETLSDDLKEVNREIRKLWDLSNKRNKVNIQKLTKQTSEIENLLSNLQKDINVNEKVINKIKESVDVNIAKINNLKLTEDEIKSVQFTIKNIDTQLILLEDSVQALNSYKNQLNQAILEIQTDISKIQSISDQDSTIQN